MANPYAPPRANSTGPTLAGKGFRLDGNTLIASHDAVLPDICVWNGDAARAIERRKLTWTPPWLAIFVISPIIFLVVYLFVRKQSYLTFALSEAARERKKSSLLLGAVGVAGGLAFAIIAAGVADSQLAPILALVGVFEAAIMLVVAMRRGRMVTVSRIDSDTIQLKLPAAAAAAFARLGR